MIISMEAMSTPKNTTAKLDKRQHNIQEIHQDFKQETETIDCFQINQQWKTKKPWTLDLFPFLRQT